MENNLAVLIDFENIAAGTEKEGLGRFDVETLIQRVKDKGRILVARSYADWGRFSRFKQSLLTANVTMMELTSHGMQDKNRADIAMVVDALELAFTRGYVDTFVLVSGDSDFTPLVLKLRELNKRVIGIGTRKSTSRLLIQACDEFMFYDMVVMPKRRKPAGQADEIQAAFELLEEALDGLQRENPDPPLASVVKSAVLRKSPDFNEIELGFNSFARFLEAAQEASIVRIIRDTKSGGYRIDARDEAPAVRARTERPRSRDREQPREREPEPETEPETDEVLLAEEPAEESGRPWVDEYLPAGTEIWIDSLNQAHLHPLGAPTRMAVLEALEQVVAERQKRRRKTTLPFVRDDLKHKLRRTHPDLPDNLLRDILQALSQAGELKHRDGTAIRSGAAPFTLHKDATELNEALVRLYLAHLREAGCDLSDTALLSELMYGDRDRKREIEETLAHLVAEPAEDIDDLNLDDLLLPSGGRIDVTQAPAEPASTDKDTDDLDDLDSALLVGEPIEREAEPALFEPDDDLLLVGDEPARPARARKPEPRRPADRKPRRRRDDDISDLDLDSLLEPG